MTAAAVLGNDSLAGPKLRLPFLILLPTLQPLSEPELSINVQPNNRPLGKEKSLFFFSLLFFSSFRVRDNLSACLVWACILFLMSPPTRQEWSHSFLCFYVSLSCGFSQPPWLEKSYFLKSRIFIQQRSERESAARCSLVLLAVAGRGGLGRVCRRMQQFLQGQGEEHGDPQRHWENPVLSWE